MEMGHFSLILSRSEFEFSFEFQSLASVAEQVESWIIAR